LFFIHQGDPPVPFACFRIHDGVVIRKDHHDILLNLLVALADTFLVKESKKSKNGMDTAPPAKKKSKKKNADTDSASKPPDTVSDSVPPAKKMKTRAELIKDFTESILLYIFPGHTSDPEVFSEPRGQNSVAPKFFSMR
jgi:hypothetical protein